ncbi:Bifunctional solanapyrone synthase [Fusarium oxysporum f. sp. albedinis]|nr:Bifunctional solanapyrone synthase [Fusarium oxysporum f. sp. albedinis]
MACVTYIVSTQHVSMFGYCTAVPYTIQFSITMSYRLDTHALIVDANATHKVDIGNLANLYSMWIGKGSRLYSSVSTTGDCSPSYTTSRLLCKHPKQTGTAHQLRRLGEDDCFCRRGQGSASPSSSRSCQQEALTSTSCFGRSSSTTTESQSPEKSITASEGSSQPSPESLPHTTVVRGFSPSQIPTPRTISGAAQSSDALPEPKSSPMSNEQDQNLTDRKPIISIIKKPVFQIGGSSEEAGSLTSAVASSRPSSPLSAHEDQASFSNHVMTRTIDDEAAVDSDTDDYIDESAIDDDDDSSDWEDSMEESGKSSMDDKFFQRVDSKPNLTSRRSLITLMLAQNNRLGNHASKSTSAIPRSRMANGPSLGASPNDSDEAPLMMKGMRGPSLKPIHEVPRSKAQPIITGPSHIQPQAALSPRTNRRNMLATELTESLRRHLLWERQVKSSTANAVLKRQHTSHDVADLKQYPEKPCMKKSEDVNASSWNQYFSKEANDGYHSKGW